MLEHSAFDIVGNACIENGMMYICCYVNVIAIHGESIIDFNKNVKSGGSKRLLSVFCFT